LWPDYTHDSIGSLREHYGPTPAADYLIPLFDEWMLTYPSDPHVPEFWNLTRLVLGGKSSIENYGNRPSQYAFVESDGAIEGLDVLKICEDGLSRTGLNVTTADFVELETSRTLAAKLITEGLALPTQCEGCPERETCSGGYVPHRYSRADHFDRASVWCADILKVFNHVRMRLGVSQLETGERRRTLSLSAAE
jgi:uncharacterized protein